MADMTTSLLGALVIVGLTAAIGLALLYAARQLPQNPESPADRINDLLPQTQCAQCGFPGCRPYAQAIVDGEADINQCVPGGDALVMQLSRLLGRSPGRLDRNFGQPQLMTVAAINESACIGCAICIAACPVDAILGASRYTHTVIESECTGCELCIAPCPVDCIALTPIKRSAALASRQDGRC